MLSDEEIRENIRRQIIKYRKHKNLSQEKLGELLGVKKTTVSSWEVGKSLPDICTIYKISKIFGIKIDELYGIYDFSMKADDYIALNNLLERMNHYSELMNESEKGDQKS